MERYAGALHHLGVRKGDRVTIFAHNGMDYLLGLFACWRIGAIAALVNVRFADELDYYFADHEPSVVIYTHDMLDPVRRAALNTPTVRSIVCMDGPQPNAESLPDLLKADLRPPPDPADEDAIAHLSYTSGTTGKPKGACLAHEPTMRAANCIRGLCRQHRQPESLGRLKVDGQVETIDHQLSDKRKPDPERGAAVIPVFGPDPPIVRLDNGARDGQPHPHAFGFAGEERLEDLVQVVFRNSWPMIRHGEFGKVLGARALNADDAVFGRCIPHRVDPIHNKVQNDLLKLNAVAEDRKRLRCDLTDQLDLSSSSERRKKSDSFPRKIVEVEILQLERRLFQEAAQPSDDLGGASIITENILQDFVQLDDIGLRRFKDSLCRLRICQDRPKRLVDFVSD